MSFSALQWVSCYCVKAQVFRKLLPLAGCGIKQEMRKWRLQRCDRYRLDTIYNLQFTITLAQHIANNLLQAIEWKWFWQVVIDAVLASALL